MTTHPDTNERRRAKGAARVTLLLTPEDLKTLDAVAWWLGATRTGALRLMIREYRTPVQVRQIRSERGHGA